MLRNAGDTLETASSYLRVSHGDTGLIVHKTAKSRSRMDLADQIDALAALPPRLERGFPRLLSSDSDPMPSWYEMPLYPYPSLRELVFDSETPSEVLHALVEVVMNFLFSELYAWKTGQADQDFVTRVHLNRVNDRLSEVCGLDSTMREALMAPVVILNGRTQPCPQVLLRQILDSTASSKLAPRLLTSIHGQLEFDHILINESSKEFVLLDTSGFRRLSDIAYDLGKLFQSARSRVDLIKEDKFGLDFSASDGVLRADLSLSSVRSRVCEDLCRHIIDLSASRSADDPDLVMRADFAEAMHLCASVPYYYSDSKAGRSRALAMYLAGAGALYEFTVRYLSRSRNTALASG